MSQAIDLLWSGVKDRLYITREAFEESLNGWTLEPMCRDDGAVGFIFSSRGPEFHFSTFGTGMQATRAVLKKYPGEIIARYGFALTKTPKPDIRQQRFNERIGFYRVGEDEYDIFYRIDQMRKKESTCPL